MNVYAARRSVFALAVPLVAVATGCDREPTDPDDIPGRTGRLQIELGSETVEDVDPRVEQVWVRVETVQVRHEDNGFVEVSQERQDVDLMAEPVILGDADVWTGSYDRTQIAVVDQWIVVDGVEEELGFLGDVDPLDPLGAGLIESETFFVDEGSGTQLRIHWNLDDNLEARGDGWFLGASTFADVDIIGAGDDDDDEDPEDPEPTE